VKCFAERVVQADQAGEAPQVTSSIDLAGSAEVQLEVKPAAKLQLVLDILEDSAKARDLKTLLSNAESFYGKEEKRETEELKIIGAAGAQKPADNDAFTVRIGRHSGAECVTIEGHRQIRIKQGRGRRDLYKNHATTIWLTSETDKPDQPGALLPMGWISLGVITAEMAIGFEGIEKEYLEKSVCDIQVQQEDKKPNIRPKKNMTTETGVKQKPAHSIRETWENPFLSWHSGKSEVTAVFENKKATGKGKDLVPEKYHSKLFGKKKRAAPEKVVVEAIGNAWRIVEIV
jgi:CRISPR-associated protein Csm5